MQPANVDEFFARLDIVLSYNPEKDQAKDRYIEMIESELEAQKRRSIRAEEIILKWKTKIK